MRKKGKVNFINARSQGLGWMARFFVIFRNMGQAAWFIEKSILTDNIISNFYHQYDFFITMSFGWIGRVTRFVVSVQWVRKNLLR